MEGELLFTGSGGRVPDDGGPVHPRAEDVVPSLIPFQGKYRPLVLAQGLLLLSIGVPDSAIIIINAGILTYCQQLPGVTVVAAGCEKLSVTVPVQAGDVFVAGDLLPLHLYAVLQHLHCRLPTLSSSYFML